MKRSSTDQSSSSVNYKGRHRRQALRMKTKRSTTDKSHRVKWNLVNTEWKKGATLLKPFIKKSSPLSMASRLILKTHVNLRKLPIHHLAQIIFVPSIKSKYTSSQHRLYFFNSHPLQLALSNHSFLSSSYHRFYSKAPSNPNCKSKLELAF